MLNYLHNNKSPSFFACIHKHLNIKHAFNKVSHKHIYYAARALYIYTKENSVGCCEFEWNATFLCNRTGIKIYFLKTLKGRCKMKYVVMNKTNFNLHIRLGFITFYQITPWEDEIKENFKDKVLLQCYSLIQKQSCVMFLQLKITRFVFCKVPIHLLVNFDLQCIITWYIPTLFLYMLEDAWY